MLNHQIEFTIPLFDLLKETFEDPSGIYLDKRTSLHQTLEAVSAQQASIPVGGKCASLAAQVAHVTFLGKQCMIGCEAFYQD
jgi:hypothetical protein